jgi:site-specific DNA-cytosine methylase
MRVVGPFAGIGGIELGFERAGGFETELLCESWVPAQAVLSRQFGIEDARRSLLMWHSCGGSRRCM